ncbi:MAG TPA: hypothetical protein VME43_26140 [Bryobacteraceae bacterium]|nr:hypothetical protein [Bryobacteraceae bacterium]
MNARTLTAASLATAFAAVLPAQAADSQLLNLVMPDAVVVAGANVAQAKTSQFGQYVLQQIQSQDSTGLQKLIAATGFDPTQDVSETLAASNGTSKTGLVLALGTFDPAKFAAAATQDKAVLETYDGVTIIEGPNKEFGLAFPNASIAVAGDLADVKAALDRVASPSVLPAALMVQIQQWSGSEDAWAISTVPLSTFHKNVAGTAKTPAAAVPGLNGQGVFQAIQSAAGGIKFGTNDVITAQAQADNAQDAQSMVNALKLLVSLAQLQASKEPAVAAVAQSLQVSATGTTLNVSLSIAESTLEQLIHSGSTAARKPLHRN